MDRRPTAQTLERVTATVRHRVRRCGVVAVVAAMSVLGGCAVKTESISDGERDRQARIDVSNLYANQPVVGDQLTLEEAMVRAVRLNVDQRVRRLEEAIALGRVDLARAGMLPGITASAGYHTRSNDAGGRSQSLLSGEQSLEPSTSMERSRDTSDLQVVWNVLDFGVSYVAAKQRQDQARISVQRRRQAESALMSDVAEAFHAAWLSDQYSPVLQQLGDRVDEQIARYDGLIDDGVAKQESYRRQHQMLEVRTRIRTMMKRFVASKIELLQLINAPLDSNVVLADPRRSPPATEQLAPLDILERMALRKRPELFDADYRHRISLMESRKAVLRMFPGLEFTTGRSSDSNRFLYNGSWRQSGLRLGWNLVNIGANIAEKRIATAETDLAQIKRESITLGILAQLRIAVAKFQLAGEELDDRKRLKDVLMGLQNTVSKVPEAVTAFELLKTNASAVMAAVQTDLAWIDLELSRLAILSSIGVDLVPESDLEILPEVQARQLQTRMDELLSTYFGIRYE